MYIGSLPRVINEAGILNHIDQTSNTVNRALIAARNKGRDEEGEDIKDYKRNIEYSNNGTANGILKGLGYKQGLKTKDENKSPGYYAAKGIYKVFRPLGHAGDLMGRGIDYVGDKIYSTKIGKKVGDAVSDFVHDDRGKYAGAHAVLAGLGNYAVGRLNANANGLSNNKAYHAADIGIGALDAANTYHYAKKKQKRSEKEIKFIQKRREDFDKYKRKMRDERIGRFWDDMTS